jgi:antitoxin component HigA of HigAB toxin-antitoxin module
MAAFDGNKLMLVLEIQGRTVRWLAARTGYNEAGVSRMLNGKQPLTRQFVEAAAPVLGIPPDLLVSDEPAEVSA